MGAAGEAGEQAAEVVALDVLARGGDLARRVPPVGRRASRPSPAWILAVAASVVAVLATALWLSAGRGGVPTGAADRIADAPVADPMLLELVPEAVRRGDSGIPEVSRERAGAFVVLVLVSELPGREGDAAVVEIVDEASRVRRGPLEVVRTSSGTYTLLLPRGGLVSGEYRVRVVDPGGDGSPEEYRFLVPPRVAGS